MRTYLHVLLCILTNINTHRHLYLQKQQRQLAAGGTRNIAPFEHTCSLHISMCFRVNDLYLHPQQIQLAEAVWKACLWPTTRVCVRTYFYVLS